MNTHVGHFFILFLATINSSVYGMEQRRVKARIEIPQPTLGQRVLALPLELVTKIIFRHLLTYALNNPIETVLHELKLMQKSNRSPFLQVAQKIQHQINLCGQEYIQTKRRFLEDLKTRTDHSLVFGSLSSAEIALEVRFNKKTGDLTLIELLVSSSNLIKIQEFIADKLLDVNDCYGVQGNTLLHMAAQSNNVALAQMLLNNGARCNIANNQGRYALDIGANDGSFMANDVHCLLKKNCPGALQTILPAPHLIRRPRLGAPVPFHRKKLTPDLSEFTSCPSPKK